MVTPSIGIVELLMGFVVTILWLAIPVGILYLLFIIYKKLTTIEELLKKTRTNKRPVSWIKASKRKSTQGSK